MFADKVTQSQAVKHTVLSAAHIKQAAKHKWEFNVL